MTTGLTHDDTFPGLEEDQRDDLGDFDTSDPDDAADADADDQRPGKPARAGSAARKRAADKALVRRAAAKVVELTSADAADRSMLAAVLGVDDDPVDLTVAVLSASKGSLAGIQEALDVAEIDDIEKGVVLMSMGRARMRGLWQMYSDLGVPGFSGNIPSADSKAALGLARAEIDDTVRGRLRRVMNLAKRS